MRQSILAFLLLLYFQLAAQQPQPNVIIFFVDDLGWKDIGANGSSFYETPNINALAKKGVLFTQAYASAPVCSPTRVSMMTGKYPAALKTTDWFGAPQPWTAATSKQWSKKTLLPAEYREYLPPSEITLAEAMQNAGYSTFISGKWHLGYDSIHWPEHHGFGKNVGGNGQGHPPSYFSPWKNPRLSDDPPGTYLGDRLTDETVQFIKQQNGKPFFAYIPFYEVHTPLQAKQHLIDKYKQKKAAMLLGDSVMVNGAYKVRVEQSNPVYAAMVETMDAQVGRIMDALKTEGLESNTIVIFTSDNGGLSTAEGMPTSNLPLRAGKGWMYEGGIRVPLIIAAPGIKQGRVSKDPAITNDIYPTVLALCGLPLQPTQHSGGISLLPALAGKPLQRDALYWHYPHYGNQGGAPAAAIRKGDWKLIHHFERNTFELYNLSKDIGEHKDLATNNQKKVAELKQQLVDWQNEVHAKFPSINNIADTLKPDTNYLSGIREMLRHRWPNNRMINLVFHGHSVPTGYFKAGALNQQNAYPLLLGNSLETVYPTVPVNCIRTSIGGEQAEQGAKRFDSTVLNHHPDVLFIDYALNDRSIGLERAATAWKSMIEKALAKNIKVILLTPTPDLKEDILELNTPLAQHAAQIRKLGKQYGLPVIDSYESFRRLKLAGEDLSRYMSQNNHPNALGHAVVAKELMQLFK